MIWLGVERSSPRLVRREPFYSGSAPAEGATGCGCSLIPSLLQPLARGGGFLVMEILVSEVGKGLVLLFSS